jgi:hypothetical protein
MGEPTSYQGGSIFLRWWPTVLLAFAVAALLLGGFGALQWATLLILVTYFHIRWMPWQFTIQADGIELAFPFGRRIFLPKASLTVRMESLGATALIGRHRRFGYPLLDSILYVPGRTLLLRTAFTGLGYELTELK